LGWCCKGVWGFVSGADVHLVQQRCGDDDLNHAFGYHVGEHDVGALKAAAVQVVAAQDVTVLHWGKRVLAHAGMMQPKIWPMKTAAGG
jgi:hypothetical protein